MGCKRNSNREKTAKIPISVTPFYITLRRKEPLVWIYALYFKDDDNEFWVADYHSQEVAWEIMKDLNELWYRKGMECSG